MNTIHPTAIIHSTVKIGNNNYIGPNYIIGDIGESIIFFNPEKKGVIIGNNNRFTKQITIDSRTENPTIIINNTLCLKNAHAGYDVIAEYNTKVRSYGIIREQLTLNESSKVYLNAIVHPRLVITRNRIVDMEAV